jgi:hypothetical protein
MRRSGAPALTLAGHQTDDRFPTRCPKPARQAKMIPFPLAHWNPLSVAHNSIAECCSALASFAAYPALAAAPACRARQGHRPTHARHARVSPSLPVISTVVGISQSLSAQIGKIVRALPLDTTQMAKEQRIRRLLDNERLTQSDHFQPLAKAALHGLIGRGCAWPLSSSKRSIGAKSANRNCES